MLYSAYKLNKQSDNIQPWYTPFPISNQSVVSCPFLTVIFWPAYRFPWRQVRVAWYSHLLKNFPQFAVIHTINGFSIVSEAEVDVYLKLSCFFNDPTKVSNWSLVPLPFLNPAWISGSSQFMNCWSLAWRILSISLLACEMSPTVWWFEHSLTLLFFGIGMETDLFQSCGYCWVFQICSHIEFSSFTASYSRYWNNSAEIPSPPLDLFVVMLPKAHCLRTPGCLALGEWSHHSLLSGSTRSLL